MEAFILLFTFIADNLPSCCNRLLYVHQSSKFSISCTNSSLSFEKAPVVRAWSSNISFIMAVTRPPKTKRGKTSRKCHQIQKKMFKKFKQRIRKMWTMLHTNIAMKKNLGTTKMSSFLQLNIKPWKVYHICEIDRQNLVRKNPYYHCLIDHGGSFEHIPWTYSTKECYTFDITYIYSIIYICIYVSVYWYFYVT